MRKKIYCNYCGKSYSGKWKEAPRKYCRKCFHLGFYMPLPEKDHRYCVGCGEKIEEKKKYCLTCNPFHPQKESWEFKRFAETLAQRNPELVKVTFECFHNHPKKHKHHPDYHKPFEVEKLCPSCHSRTHWGSSREIITTA